jgi:hypothetical protein
MGEKGSWTLNYIPADGGRITGELIVTDEEVLFRALYDSSFKTIAKSLGLIAGSMVASGGSLAILRESGSDAEIVLPTESIARADAAKKGLMKRVIVTLTNGEEFVFDYGMLSTKKIVEAING